jgi:hypothetical protein
VHFQTSDSCERSGASFLEFGNCYKKRTLQVKVRNMKEVSFDRDGSQHKGGSEGRYTDTPQPPHIASIACNARSVAQRRATGNQGKPGPFSIALRQTCQLVCGILFIVIYRNQQPVGRISSASPQLGAAKRGQEAGIAPGRSPPAQPRLPPGPKGLPEGAEREPANGTPETQTQRNRQELKIRYGRPSVSLVFQLLCRLQESSPVHELLQACP